MCPWIHNCICGNTTCVCGYTVFVEIQHVPLDTQMTVIVMFGIVSHTYLISLHNQSKLHFTLKYLNSYCNINKNTILSI